MLIIAGMQLDYINSQRQQMKLIANEPLENAPPSLAFATVAMGAFRGLLVDVLWLRAESLKDKGEFFDAKQIAEWITTLQPRFASVWEFQAWNMAYNISVAIPATEPEERWRWVKNGYELLRDQGIPLNPKSMLLYRELARIFQHKIGFVSDDAHKYYKLQLALALEPLLGPADNQFFEELADAPSDWEEIIKDPEVERLINALKLADKAFDKSLKGWPSPDKNFVGNYLSLRQNPAGFSPEAFKVIDNFRGTETIRKFDIFAKAKQLRNEWKLDPALIRELNQTYGPIDLADPNKRLPLDWRHPDTHAIYWAAKGLQAAGNKEFSIDEINTDRIVNQSLQGLFRNGKIFIYDVPVEISSGSNSPSSLRSAETSQTPQIKMEKDIFYRPDLRMFESYNKAALSVIEKYDDLGDMKQGSLESLKIGHRNMLTNAIFSFYQAGHIKYAEKIYEQMRKLYPQDKFKVPLVVFVKNRLREELQNTTIDNAKELVVMMLRESYFRYAMHEDNEAFGREKMAKEAYDHYQSPLEDEHRIDLPDFALLKYLALTDFLNDPQYPPNMRLALFNRINMERPELAEQLKKQEEMIFKQLEQQSK
ncbi:MAG: hypothetical protein JW947_09200 [Sedimentisphaerales bacterium]|nr:hypothetical protein [Sedimentisphaerales bacterium]